MQRQELRIIEAERLHTVGVHLDLLGAPAWTAADEQVLESRASLDDGSGPIDAEPIGCDEAGHHDLAEAPGRLDHAHVRTADRIAAEQHARRQGFDHALHHDADLWRTGDAQTL